MNFNVTLKVVRKKKNLRKRALSRKEISMYLYLHIFYFRLKMTLEIGIYSDFETELLNKKDTFLTKLFFDILTHT
jgi:hypothetical protein